MKVLNAMLWTSISAVALGTLGCDVFVSGRPREDRVYVQQQPQYVEQQPQYVYVQQAPPPVVVEVRPAAPSSTHIWIDGSWGWDNQRYVWQKGRYEVPPQQGSVWVAGSYQHDAKGYRYAPGQWKKQNQANDRDHEQDRH